VGTSPPGFRRSVSAVPVPICAAREQREIVVVLIEQDGNIVGRWKRTDGSHWGELSGTAEGNVLHFTWNEHKYGGVGPSADSKGSGVFVYKMGEKFGELDGQYALADSNDVGSWHCVKQVGLKPDLNSINGKGNDNMGVTPDQWK